MDSKHIHKVRRADLENAKENPGTRIKAVCGFIWDPVFPMDFNKPKCEICFPERISDRCYAA